MMELKKLKAPRTYLLAHLLRANGTCPADEPADLLLAFALTMCASKDARGDLSFFNSISKMSH